MELKFKAEKFNSRGCRICDLYELNKYPIKSLKIIGRGKDSRYTVKLVKVISKALLWLKSDAVSKRDYQRNCRKLFSKIILNNKMRCTKFDCYFSPHWLRNEKRV